jgi:hypothetical protein
LRSEIFGIRGRGVYLRENVPPSRAAEEGREGKEGEAE